MKAEEIQSVNAPSGLFNRTTPAASRSGKAGGTPSPDQVNSDKVKTTPLDHIQFNKLEASNTDSQDIAQAIREVNHAMERVDDHLHKMQAALEGIVKIYPPYPPGSAERVEALRQFSAFRKMIDQIALPGRVNGLQDVLGDPARNPRSGDWTPASGHRASGLRIRHQPVHAGPGGLDLPRMGGDSTDAQITAAIEKTVSATHTLQSRRRAFIADANKVISRIA